MEVSSN